MLINSYRYREFWNTPQAWEVEEFHIGQINLLVGRNASGKSRIVNTIGTLSAFLNRKSVDIWNSGEWEIDFVHEGQSIRLDLCVQGKKVVRENILVNGETRLSRGNDGSGKIWFEKVRDYVDFKISDNIVAMVTRRDTLQHSYLEPLFDWAKSLRQYQFSTDLGRQTIALINNLSNNPENSEKASVIQVVTDQNAVVEQYRLGFEAFGDAFDQSIIDDMAGVGYKLESVHAVHAEEVPFVGGNLPIILQVKEKDLSSPTRQFQISTGMFRALAIIIHLNFALLSNAKSTIIIDDIGEGLDFQRSKSLIDVLIRKCEDSDIQLILTSNDRFVMNEVDLSYWHVLDRTGQLVRVIDKNNSPDRFNKFKYLGLSNFDFFSMEAFKGAVHQ